MSVTDEIKARIDIVDLVGESVQLQRSGQTFKARCPFHDEKTPSFVVDPRRQTWRCFGACSEGGDAFSWVMKRESVEFREALSRLADRTGVRLTPRSPESAARDDARQRLLAANDAALNWWRRRLSQPEGADAREQLTQRGLSAESVERFAIGAAGPEPDALLHHLAARGFRSEELERAGLVVVTEQGPRDRFRDRLIFPIRNARGECVGFGGRTLIGENAKYINTPESDLFRKRELLYGLDLARDAIRRAGHVIVVEGYTDVISAHEHGTLQTVASMGTALTDAQVALLKPLTADIRFALDADAAGQAATRRGIETTREAIDPGQRTLAEIRIIELPEGRDPDDLIQQDPQLWNSLIENAPIYLDWLFKRGREAHDLDDPRERSAFVRELAPLVQAIPDAVVRSEYLQRLAAYGRVEVSALPGPRQQTRPRQPRSAEAQRADPAPRRADAAQTYILMLAISRPEAAAELNERALGLIDDAEDRGILTARINRIGDEEWDSELSPVMQERISELRRAARDLPPYTHEEACDAAREAVERLTARRTREWLRLQTQDLAQIEERFDRSAVALAAEAHLDGDVDQLDPDLSEAAERVVQARDEAWLLHHPRERGGQGAHRDANTQELVRPAARGSQQ